MARRKLNVGILTVLVLLLVAVPIVSGCAAEGGIPKGWPQEVTIAAGSKGVQYTVGAYLCDNLQREYGIRGTPVAGASDPNLVSLGKGEFQVVNAVGPSAIWAVTGKESFAETGAMPAIRLMAVCGDLLVHFTASKDSGIKSVADLRGKRFLADQKGVHYWDQTIVDLLAENRLTKEDITIGSFAGSSAAMASLVAGDVDAQWSGAPSGVGFMLDAFMTRDLVFIPIPESFREEQVGTYSWMALGMIPAGTYKGQDQDVPTLSARLSWNVHRDLPDDFVYKLLEYCYDPEYRADFEALRSSLATEVTLQRAVLNPVIPFHTGAVKFYKDTGVWTQELDKWQKDLLKQIGESR